jgi:hypothetical protein
MIPSNPITVVQKVISRSLGGVSLLIFLGALCSTAASRAASQVITWGNTNNYGLGTVPASLTNVVALAADESHSAALKADGKVVVWGDNSAGQTKVPAAAMDHTVALKSNRTVLAWGTDGTNVPPGLTHVVSIAGGSFHSLAEAADGNVVVWGRAGDQLLVPATLTNAVAVAAGLFYCTAVKADGTVATCGDNSQGQTNLPPILTNATRIVAGWYHAIAVTSDGAVTACDTSSAVPAGFTYVIALGAGYFNNLALEATSPPAAQVLFLNPRMDAGRFSVSLPTQSGRVYRLEYTTSLTDTNWTGLPLVPGNGAAVTLTDPAAAGTHRFYRARQW